MNATDPNTQATATQPGTASTLEIAELGVTLRGKPLLQNVSLTLAPGKISGVAGESGSGKTMTGLAVMGLLPTGATTTGAVRYRDTNLLTLRGAQLNAMRGRNIAMVFQDPSTSLHPMLRVGAQLTDHMRTHLGLSKRAALQRAAELLERVNIPQPVDALNKYPHQFSGGMRQRIAIAVALACEPDVLIADEPTTALDVTVQAGVLRLLRGLCDDLGLAVMLVTHDLGVMSAIADEVTVMRHGSIVEHGHRFDVLTRPSHPYTRELIAALPGNTLDTTGISE